MCNRVPNLPILNPFSANPTKWLFECVWPFCGVGAKRVKRHSWKLFQCLYGKLWICLSPMKLSFLKITAQINPLWESCTFNLMKAVLKILLIHLNDKSVFIPFHPNPGQRKKQYLKIFIFTLLCGASKGFMKALKAFIKLFATPQRSVKIKS